MKSEDNQNYSQLKKLENQMFIHFDLDREEQCDNCNTVGTLMHLTCVPQSRMLNLCKSCFRSLTAALMQADRKLGREAPITD